jgi:hypothetical protein
MWDAAAGLTDGDDDVGADFRLDYLGDDRWQLSVCSPSGRVVTARGDLERLRKVLLRADRLLLLWLRASRQATESPLPLPRPSHRDSDAPVSRRIRKGPMARGAATLLPPPGPSHRDSDAPASRRIRKRFEAGTASTRRRRKIGN